VANLGVAAKLRVYAAFGTADDHRIPMHAQIGCEFVAKQIDGQQ